jgi:hypothetical protein
MQNCGGVQVQAPTVEVWGIDLSKWAACHRLELTCIGAREIFANRTCSCSVQPSPAKLIAKISRAPCLCPHKNLDSKPVFQYS